MCVIKQYKTVISFYFETIYFNLEHVEFVNLNIQYDSFLAS